MIGGFWGATIVILLRLAFRSNIGVADGIAGAMAGAVVGLIPALCLPNRFSLPKDITTITHRAIGAFCLWVGANGLVKGEIHGIDRRGFLRAFNEPVLWERDPLLFLTYFLVWSAVGIITTAIPVFYFLKAIRDTSGFTSAPLPGEKTLLPTYRKWKDLPENFQAIFVFTIVLSSILVFFLLGFGTRTVMEAAIVI